MDDQVFSSLFNFASSYYVTAVLYVLRDVVVEEQLFAFCVNTEVLLAPSDRSSSFHCWSHVRVKFSSRTFLQSKKIRIKRFCRQSSFGFQGVLRLPFSSPRLHALTRGFNDVPMPRHI